MSSTGRAERIKASSINVGAEETTLSHSYEGTGQEGVQTANYGGMRGLARGGWVWAIVLFLFFVFIVFIILVAWAPKWLVRLTKDCDDSSRGKSSRGGAGLFGTRTRGCVDYGKTFLWAIVISVIVLLLFWLLTAVTAGLAAAFVGNGGNRKKHVAC